MINSIGNLGGQAGPAILAWLAMCGLQTVTLLPADRQFPAPRAVSVSSHL